MCLGEKIDVVSVFLKNAAQLGSNGAHAACGIFVFKMNSVQRLIDTDLYSISDS